MTSIPITRPCIGEEEKRAIIEPLESGWVVQGPQVERFEGAFCDYSKSDHAAATTSCTTALHLAVAALELGPGQEVIVPAFTWVSTANVVEYMGATPIFCDIELDTFNIDPARIEALITPRTVGIIPVHLFGLCADMDPILAIAHAHDLWIVEDAACALGGWYAGRHAGTFGEFGCFSFHPRKSITTGEGGMVTSQDSKQDELIRSLRDHGASRTDLERHTSRSGFLLPEYARLGYNYRMTDIQGALGRVQMGRLPSILGARARLAERYDHALETIDWLRSPLVPGGRVHGYQAYVALFRPEPPGFATAAGLGARRNALMSSLQSRGIATRQGTHAVVTQTFYVDRYDLRPEQFPNAVVAEQTTLALPLFPDLTDDEQSIVIDALIEARP